MDAIHFTDTDGRKRWGVFIDCPMCGKHFLTRKDKPHVVCSQECQGRLRSSRGRVEVICAKCGSKFEKRLSHLKGSKSGLYFCSRRCKDDAQRIGGIKEIMPPHYGASTGIWTYRDLFSQEQLICVRCGYKEFSCGVAIHHIDHNRKNNKKSNLVPLCMPCHRALHCGFWKFEEINWQPFLD